MSSPEQPVIYKPARDNSTAKGCGIGCLVLLGALAVIAGVGIYVVWSMSGAFFENFTQEAPRPLPPITMPQEQQAALIAQVNAFAESLESGTAVEPLRLSADDINVLLAHFGADAPLFAQNIHVTIDDDLLKADVSIPTKAFGLAAGRFINGTGVFNVRLENGDMAVYLQDLTVGSVSIPEAALAAFRQENLAAEAAKTPEARRLISRMESITVSNGEIVLTPRTGGNP
ncbi:MAG: hypothetical protein GC168_10815 [Candidatus Hydrogenedens sp.]|nr:hypothetical protein [Candidatus Hydrogenedens sp.]